MALCILDRNRRTWRISGADKHSHLQLVIEPARRQELWVFRAGRLDLPLGTSELLSGNTDGRGSAVIADGYPLVVGEQRVVRAEQRAYRGRVIDRCVEVGVITDSGGHRIFSV